MSFFKKVGKILGTAAPILGTILGGPLGLAGGKILGTILGVDGTDEAALEAALKNNPEALAKVKLAEFEMKVELQKIALQAESISAEKEINNLAQVNRTIRAETKSEDAYVRRWRPTFGYTICFAWAVQFLSSATAILYSAFSSNPAAGLLAENVIKWNASTMPLWAIALPILGVSVYKRSQDKMIQMKQEPKGVISSVKELVHG